MTATYDNFGVRFLYPENWSLTEEPSEWPRVVSVESPGTGFWLLHIYAPPVAPSRVAAEVLRAMRDEYDAIDVESVAEDFDGEQAVGYDMDFCCLDLIVTSRTRSFQAGGRTYLVQWQAEDREFERLDAVFRAITTSLLNFIHQRPLAR